MRRVRGPGVMPYPLRSNVKGRPLNAVRSAGTARLVGTRWYPTLRLYLSPLPVIGAFPLPLSARSGNAFFLCGQHAP